MRIAPPDKDTVVFINLFTNDPVPVIVFNGVGAPSNFMRPLEFLHKNSSLGLLIPRTVY